MVGLTVTHAVTPATHTFTRMHTHTHTLTLILTRTHTHSLTRSLTHQLQVLANHQRKAAHDALLEGLAAHVLQQLAEVAVASGVDGLVLVS